MRKLLVLSIVGMMAFTGCSTERKYDKKQLKLQKQEAKEMIDKADGVEIDRAKYWGKDEIKLDN